MFSFDFEEFRQMDNYQKMILMISILTVMTAAGKTLVGAVSMIMNIIGPVSSAEYTEMVFGRSFGLIFSGVISLITGMLGMRAARDPGRIRPDAYRICVNRKSFSAHAVFLFKERSKSASPLAFDQGCRDPVKAHPFSPAGAQNVFHGIIGDNFFPLCRRKGSVNQMSLLPLSGKGYPGERKQTHLSALFRMCAYA